MKTGPRKIEFEFYDEESGNTYHFGLGDALFGTLKHKRAIGLTRVMEILEETSNNIDGDERIKVIISAGE